MADKESKTRAALEKVDEFLTVDNLQKYILGYKKNGQPRAVYDIVKDYLPKRKRKKNKKKKNKKKDSAYSLYLDVKKGKKKKNKKDKHWHI